MQTVFVIKPQGEIRQNPKDRNPRKALEFPNPWFENLLVSLEFVDHKSPEVLSVFLSKRPGSIQSGKHSAPLNVPHKEHGDVEMAGKVHVGKIPFLEIELRRTPHPLNADEIALCKERRKALHDGVPEYVFRKRGKGRSLPPDLPQKDNLN
jgi:hypothetical protein